MKDSPPPSPCYSQPSPPYSSQSSPLQNIVYVDDITPDLSSAINPVIITQPKYNTILNSKVRIKPKPVSAVNTQTVKISQPKPPSGRVF